MIAYRKQDQEDYACSPMTALYIAAQILSDIGSLKIAVVLVWAGGLLAWPSSWPGGST